MKKLFDRLKTLFSASRLKYIIPIAVIILATVIAIITVSSIASKPDITNTAGLSPYSDGKIKYKTEELIGKFPKTYEATVKIPTDYSGSSSIVSTQSGVVMPSFSLYVNADGKPTLSTYYGVKEQTVVRFDDVNLKTDNWEHLAVVIDEDSSQILCYLNGALVGEETGTVPSDTLLANPLLVGGSYSLDSFFSGSIIDVALYSDVRSEREIKKDIKKIPKDKDLICYYRFDDFDSEAVADSVADLSKNEYNLVRYNALYDEPEKPLKDYAYSFAIVGDPQTITRKYPEKLTNIYNWIANNKEEKKIAFAFNLGDLTDKDTEDEWNTASAAIHSLDGILPYSIVRGNHDKTISSYTNAFKYADHEYMLSGSYDGTMLNTYQTLHVSDDKYLILNLDFKMTTPLLDWASDIVEQHHDYKVIVTTHMYLDYDGAPLNGADEGGPDKHGVGFTSEGFWNLFLSKHNNIFLVLSGHVAYPSIVATQRTGDHGNTVTQILVNPQNVDGKYQGGLGLVAMLYFSEDGKSVQTQFYSTIRNKYFLVSNELEITLN